MAIKETKNIYEALQQYHEEVIKPKVKEIIEQENKDTSNIITNYSEADTLLKEHFEEQLAKTDARLTSADNQLREDLLTEISTRETKDSNLDIRIDEEALARIARDIELTNYVDAEIARLTTKTETELVAGLNAEAHKRIEEDIEIRKVITNESNLRTAEYNTMLKAVSDEATIRRKNDEHVLAAAQEELSNAITEEANRTNVAIEALNTTLVKKIDDADVVLSNSLAQEVKDRKEAVKDEENSRIDAINEVKGLISAEEDRADSIEKELRETLDREIPPIKGNISTLTTNLAAEKSEREKKDAEFYKSLADEISNRDNAINNLSTSLVGKITEETGKVATTAHSELETAIITLTNTTIAKKDKELSDRIDSLSNSLETEASTRQDAITTLTNKIDQDINGVDDRIDALILKHDNESVELYAAIRSVAQNVSDETFERAGAINALRTSLESSDIDLQKKIKTNKDNIDVNKNSIYTNKERISAINELIPTTATTINKLADKAYVETLISSQSSTFVGTFNSLAELEAVQDVAKNSYAFVKTDSGYTRYKYVSLERVWKEEYTLVTTSSDLELALDTINNSLNTINTICSNNKIAIEEEVTARTSKTESLDNEIELIKTNYATNTALSKHISNMTLDDNGNWQSRPNPHNVTAAQIGLGNVVDIGMDQEPILESSKYITSNAVAIVKENLTNAVNDHKNNIENPHKVSAAQIGLGKVANRDIIDEVKESDDYISSRGVKAALDIVKVDLTDHALSTENPHIVTKEQVLLGAVENQPMDDVPSNTDHYVKSRGVKTAIDLVQTNLNSHSIASNPHGITKATIGLGDVVNAGLDLKPQSESNNYITSGGVYSEINNVNTSLTAEINSIKSTLATKITIEDISRDLKDYSNSTTKFITAEEIPDKYITEEILSSKNYLTEIPVEYVTELKLSQKGYLTAHQSLEEYSKTSKFSQVAFTGSYNDLIDKPVLIPGEQGEQGIQGEKGDPGKSAYEIWKEVGNEGTEDQFIESLKGIPGKDGINGTTPRIGENLNWWIGNIDTGIRAEGSQGLQGIQGEKGEDGIDGKDGKDGLNGITPHIGDNGNWYLGETDTGIKAEGIKGKDGANGINGKDGADGADGADGKDGANGKSAYQIWLDNGHTGSEADFITWLKGDKGDTGPGFLKLKDGSGYYQGQVGTISDVKAGFITFILGTDEE